MARQPAKLVRVINEPNPVKRARLNDSLAVRSPGTMITRNDFPDLQLTAPSKTLPPIAQLPRIANLPIFSSYRISTGFLSVADR